jgi:hypothetical protein
MSALAMKHYSSVDFIERLKLAKFSDEQANVLAKENEDIVANFTEQTKIEIHNKDLVNKDDLLVTKLELQKEMEVIRKEMEVIRKEIEVVRKEIEQSKNQIILWVAGLFGTFGLFFLGVLAKGFHWF